MRESCPLLVVALWLSVAGCSEQRAIPGERLENERSPTTAYSENTTASLDASKQIEQPKPDVEQPSDTGPDWKHATCPELYACGQASCVTSSALGCESKCVSETAPAAASKLKDYLSCIDEVCRSKVCAAGAASCLPQCISERCQPLLLPCFSSDKSGSNGCSQLIIAQQACAKANDTFKCLGASFDTVTAAQQAAWISMHMCLSKSMKKDRWSDCLVEVLQCRGDGKSGPKACAGVVECVAACPASTPLYECLSSCHSQGTKQAQAAFVALRQCEVSAETGEASDGACFQAATECAQPSGKATCAQTDACVNQCKFKRSGNDVQCAIKCLQQATSKAAAQYADLLGCKEAQCKPKCSGDSNCAKACYATQCKPLQQACNGA